MVKHKLLALTLFFGLIFSMACCKKASTPNGKIKVETYRHQFSDTTIIDTLSYSYDQQGRVSVVQHRNGKETYTFSGNSYIYTSVSGSTVTGILNSQGFVTSTSSGDNYTYDKDGYLLSWQGPAFTSYYTIKNGNILEDSNISYGNTTIQYYTHSSIADNRDFGRSFQGKRSHNLFVNDSISTGEVDNTSYTFDSKGRVSTETISGNGILFLHTYSYFE